MRAILSFIFIGCSMRLISAVLAGAFLFAASAASADSRVFIIANQSDGYGVDQCLAKGEKCGASAARSYCRSRDFAQATSYRRVDPDEITGSVPKAGESCKHSGCNEYVAITCQR
jgi:Na+-transporting NADH:ubiquinone oxidoreductase subunit NqrB